MYATMSFPSITYWIGDYEVQTEPADRIPYILANFTLNSVGKVILAEDGVLGGYMIADLLSGIYENIHKCGNIWLLDWSIYMRDLNSAPYMQYSETAQSENCGTIWLEGTWYRT